MNTLLLHFNDLFQDTNDLIHFINIDNTIQVVNSAWLKNLEYSLDEVVGKSVYDFILPEFREKYRIYRDSIIEGRKVGTIEVVLLSKSNKPVYAEGRIACTFQNGRPVYTRAVLKNVTSQHAVEQSLNETASRLKSFFDGAPDAVIVINQDDIIEEWNLKAEKIFGFSAQEVVGTRMVDTIIPAQYREAHRRGMAHFLATGEGPVLNKTIEITALHKKGHEFFIHLSISSVNINQKWLFIAFLADITERKKMEEQLVRKEAELIQTKLLDEKKDEFLSIASHELKTPLTTIKAFTQLALAVAVRNSYPAVVDYLQKANDHTDKLTYLINELLDVSKIEAGKLSVSLVELNFNSFLNEIVESLRHITPTHQINFSACPSANVKIDALRIEQVITNFISNAAKYSPGADVIEVECTADGEFVVVSVIDHGIGIPEENLSKIFNRFYRVEEVSVHFTGLGIGLFIADEIIKQHHGRIWVKSTPGKGSVFSFSLPISFKKRSE